MNKQETTMEIENNLRIFYREDKVGRKLTILDLKDADFIRYINTVGRYGTVINFKITEQENRK